MSIRHSWVLALLGTVLLVPCAQADTRLIFPRVIFQNGRWTGFAIANPSFTDADVTITAYKTDGSVFQVANPTRIAKGSLLVRTANQVFTVPDAIVKGTTATLLWVDVTTSVSGLTGFYLEGNDSLGFLDGSDLSGIGSDLAIPIIEFGGGTTTDISIVNPETTEGSATIDFFKADGSKAAAESSTVKIPAHGALQGPLNTLFTSIDFSQVAALRMHSDRPMGCYATIYRQSDDSLIAIAGQDSSAPFKTLSFPQLAEGDPWSTSVGIHNVSSATSLLTLTAYKPDGTLFGPPTVKENPVSKQIGAGAVLRAKLKDLFGFGGSQESGWLKVEADDSSINGYVEYGAGNTRALVPAQTRSFQKSIFSYQVLTGEYFTGLAILNPGSLATTIEVASLKNDGSLYGSLQRVLKPGQKEALVIQQWIPKTSEAKAGEEGVVFIKADRETVATQLFGTNEFSALANISPQEVTTDYDPGAGIPKITVTPKLWVVETGKPKQFTTTSSGASWFVDNVRNGNDTLGKITDAGLYTAPNDFPNKHNITIQSINPDGDRAGGATVDIVRRDTLISGLNLLTSVAYFDTLSRFFIAEQQLLSSAPGEKYAATSQTLIEELSTSLTKSTFVSIPGDTISKMIPFSEGGIDYLLLAGYDSGKIYRVKLSTKELVTVRSGLVKPNSLALDPVTGNLLVSESGGANRITEIPRSVITGEPGRGSYAGTLPNAAGTAPLSLILSSAPQGVAFDLCTGTLYYILANGELHEYKNGTDSLIVTGLSNPRQIQVVYRVGMSCHDGIALVVTETNQVTLIFPFIGLKIPLIVGTTEALDLSFFSVNNPFSSEPSVIIGEGPPASNSGRISDVLVGGIYTNIPPLQVPYSPTGTTAAPYSDPVGDTFATSLSAQLTVPDIRSVTSDSVASILTPFGRVGGYVWIDIGFKDAVVSFSENKSNSIKGYIYLDTRAGGVQVPLLNQYNPYAQASGMLVDYVVDLATQKITDMVSGQVTDAKLRFWGTSVNLLLPYNFLAVETTRVVVLVGNTAEWTDVSPNSGSIKLAP